MAQAKKIGFPAGVLGEDPIRFDVLADASPSFVAVGKPADILLDSYLGSPKEKSVMLAMRETPDKPEFKRLGINSPYAVNQLDFEISGAAVIACDKDTANEMRNEMWSGTMKFEYLLLAKSAQDSQTSFDVDLPVLMHDERPVWLVSHRFGKKAHTVFERLERVGAYELWLPPKRFARTKSASTQTKAESKLWASRSTAAPPMYICPTSRRSRTR